MPVTEEVATTAQQTTYQVAGKSLIVETRDAWTANVVERLFAGWYLTRTAARDALPNLGSSTPALIFSSSAPPPLVPRSWQQFEIAGGGVCYSEGQTAYLDLEGSIVAIGVPGLAAVEVFIDSSLAFRSPVLTRVVTYALAAALRRNGLFELHSGAVVHPQSGQGILLIGPSGSGKSTLTVQLAAAGWSFLTDDVLLLGSESAGVKAWPLRRCFAITAETFAASSFLQTRATLDYDKAPEVEKQQFAPHDVFSSEFKQSCLPRALFFSELGGAEQSHVLPLETSETMARLIRMNPWSCYDRSTAPTHLSLLSSLAQQGRGFSLIAGRDLLDPEVAAGVIASHLQN